MRATLTRMLTVVGAGAMCTASLTACSALTQETGTVADSVAKLFSADPSLLTPAVPRVYEFHGDIQRGGIDSSASPLTESSSSVRCRLKVEDGVLVEALLAASVHGVREVQFELTEPVVFEFDGRPKEQIVGTGTLTVNSSVYPETRVLFEPVTHGNVMRLTTTIPVPDSIVHAPWIDDYPMQFTLHTVVSDG